MIIHGIIFAAPGFRLTCLDYRCVNQIATLQLLVTMKHENVAVIILSNAHP